MRHWHDVARAREAFFLAGRPHFRGRAKSRTVFKDGRFIESVSAQGPLHDVLEKKNAAGQARSAENRAWD